MTLVVFFSGEINQRGSFLGMFARPLVNVFVPSHGGVHCWVLKTRLDFQWSPAAADFFQ